MSILAKVIPLALLIAFGYVLRRLSFFEEISFKRIQSFLLRVTIPCMLFTAFAGMRFERGGLLVSAGMLGFMFLLLLAGTLLQRALRLPHDSARFFFASFGFGTVAFPVFNELFGAQSVAPMALLGVGHEFFVYAIFIPLLQFYYAGKGGGPRAVAKAFCSPATVMMALGLIVCVSGSQPAIAANAFGFGLLDAIAKLGSLTLPLALILSGYRIRLGERRYLGLSIRYAALRLVVGILLGILFERLFFSRVLGMTPLLGHAFYILILQHGPLFLLAFIGQYRQIDEEIVFSNAFVLNMAAGIALFFLYTLAFVAL